MSKYVWNCPACGFKEITSKFCPDCGAKKPEAYVTWDCYACGYKGITSKFCPECGTKKSLNNDEPTSNMAKGNVNNYLNRGFLFLEDGKWESADEYFEKALDIDCQCAEAYLGKLMSDVQIKLRKDLSNSREPFDQNDNYIKALRFGDTVLQKELKNCAEAVNEHITLLKEKAVRTEQIRCVEVSSVKKSKRKKKNIIFAVVGVLILAMIGIIFYSKYVADVAANSLNLRTTLRHNIISANYDYTVGIESDGTVFTHDGKAYIFEEDLSNWTDIVDISSSRFHSIGLKSDGTVAVSSGDWSNEIANWCDIVDVSAGFEHVVGVKSDGTVVAAEHIVFYGDHEYYGQCDVQEWTDIVAVSAGVAHTVGLRTDGTVIGTGLCHNSQLQKWTDIVSVSSGDYHTVGLKADGTIVATGTHNSRACNVNSWTDIVAISAGEDHTVGLKSDGTVVAVGNNDEGQCNVSEWTDIIAIAAGDKRTAGLKADGTLVVVGYND